MYNDPNFVSSLKLDKFKYVCICTDHFIDFLHLTIHLWFYTKKSKTQTLNNYLNLNAHLKRIYSCISYHKIVHSHYANPEIDNQHLRFPSSTSTSKNVTLEGFLFFYFADQNGQKSIITNFIRIHTLSFTYIYMYIITSRCFLIIQLCMTQIAK